MSTDVFDFPTAWAIQNAGDLDHHPRCSSAPGWSALSGSALLCDRGAVEAEWRRRQDATDATPQAAGGDVTGPTTEENR